MKKIKIKAKKKKNSSEKKLNTNFASFKEKWKKGNLAEKILVIIMFILVGIFEVITPSKTYTMIKIIKIYMYFNIDFILFFILFSPHVINISFFWVMCNSIDNLYKFNFILLIFFT